MNDDGDANTFTESEFLKVYKDMALKYYNQHYAVEGVKELVEVDGVVKEKE